ncbi:MAG: serine hydrolase [Myxococcota bacterium]
MGQEAGLYFPPAEGPWQTIAPGKIGWDAAKLKEALEYAGNNKSSGVVILYRGRIVAEQYWLLNPSEKKSDGGPNPYFHMRLGEDANGRAIEDVASVQKSVTAMLVGIAQHKGLLKIDDPVHKYLGTGWSKAPATAEAEITIRHLITMTSGLNSRLEYRRRGKRSSIYLGTSLRASLTTSLAPLGTSIPQSENGEYLTALSSIFERINAGIQSSRDERLNSGDCKLGVFRIGQIDNFCD